MHHQFADSQQDPDLERRLTTPDELSGLLNHAVAGLKRLTDRGRFVVPKSMKAAAAQYRANTDTVVAWGQEQLEWEHRARLQLGEAFLRYEVWCDTNNRRALGLQRFKAHVLQTFPRIRLSKSKGYPVLVGAQFRRDPDSSVKDEVITSRRRRGGEP